jgi:uncharacterized protein (TIGR04255 family)
MPFPRSKRVKFNKSPLRQVICQLRFPPILKIDTGIPADFQDKIRNTYPNFSDATEWKFEIPKMVTGMVGPDFVNQLSQQTSNKNYSFSTENETYKINLTRTFISLSTINYSVWEEFRGRLENIISAFSETYQLAYYTRIGLRYIDVIIRSELNLHDAQWKSLVKPFILGIIGDPKVGDNVEDFDSRYVIRLENEISFVKINTKLIHNEPTNENIFVIDSDFFSADKTETNKVIPALDYFNKRASRLINWAICPQLFDAMEPEKL